MRALALAGVTLVAATEILGSLGALRIDAVRLLWGGTAMAALVMFLRARPTPPRWTIRPGIEWIAAAGIALIALLTATAAALSAPNSADAMAYHLPRVIYWAQQRSVSFFPTPYFNQVALAPFAEYLMLHEYLLTAGSDRLANFGQWFGWLGSVAGVWVLAGEAGLERRGQAVAALVCATIPNGILQASGAKNDWLCAMWLVTAACLARRADHWHSALALGLAVFTKATAYIFAWPVLLLWRDKRKLPIALAGVLAVNGLHYARNVAAFGSPLGPDSARADYQFRWSNERFGLRETASNLLRHSSEQLGARSPAWNQAVYHAVMKAHAIAGIDPNDPATTWPWARFSPPRNANHEADAPSRWHFLLLLAGLLAASKTAGPAPLRLLSAGLVLGALCFCAYLKWQPFMARLWLPLFALSAPVVAGMVAKRTWSSWVVCLLLLNNTRPALLENWTRPLKGPKSLFTQDRDSTYFNDMVQWNNRDSYTAAAAEVSATTCRRVGVDIRANQVEYPLLALIRKSGPGAVFQHVSGDSDACAVVCLDCTPEYEAGYRAYPQVQRAGRFVIFLRGADKAK